MGNADESRQIAKARKKLQKRLEVIDSQFTPTALNKVAKKMQQALYQSDSNFSSSTDLKKPFQSRLNKAQTSQSVIKLRQQLLNSLQELPGPSLIGRVRVQNHSPSGKKPSKPA